MKLLRKLYNWVLHWAETPYGLLALFLLALAESSFFPIPPDPLLIALCLGAIKKSWRFALYASIASIIGGMIGYFIGFGIWQSVDSFFFKYIPGFTESLFEQVTANFNKYGFWYVFVAGFTPIPYKVFTIASGVFKLNFFLFLFASTISRSLRFFAVAALFRKFGPEIKSFIDKYFNLFAILFFLLLLGGFLLIKLFIK
ncbi:MAG: DedA family protein [Candidatus Aminicenantes bacterium]|nr:DedA family protein [Candidatus Aminicenantes bacterium]